MNIHENAHINMIKQQVRTWDINNDVVLHALLNIPREKFVPRAYQSLAFADIEIPLAHSQWLLPTKIIAKILQALEIQPTDRVLEIGTGCGYGSALLGTLSKRVFSIDPHADCGTAALSLLKSLQIHNVSFETSDGLHGLKTHMPYEIIMINGSLPNIPHTLEQQMKIGGRMALFIGDAPTMKAVIVKRVHETQWSTSTLFETVIPRLENVTEPNRFVF